MASPVSVVEAFLDQLKADLIGKTAAGTRVFRGREDPFALEELPAINIFREADSREAHARGFEKIVGGLRLELHTRGSDWETRCDALHVEAHAAMLASTVLPTLAVGIRCVETEPQSEGADRTAGKLGARYQMQILIRPEDITRRA